jgi:CCR4-NOT transcriptional regulation complex NOT5 subunit
MLHDACFISMSCMTLQGSVEVLQASGGDEWEKEELLDHIKRHQEYSRELETVLRLLDNEEVSITSSCVW